ncbi:MAG: Do family serine endopeptidase [Hyphomicrobiaceae bacterium]
MPKPTSLLFAVLILLAAALPADAQRREPPGSREAVQMSFSPIVKRAAPAVVNVYVRARVQTFVSPFADDPFFRRFLGDRFGVPAERLQNSLGSGVIVHPDGIVVTNTHVIKSSGQTEIKVALADKREFDATVLSQDDKTDIAILKLDGGSGKFPFLEFTDSDTLEVGDLVLAIGNPFNVGQTVTSGIISGLARSEVGRADSLDARVFIQTDAAINPGNSGGALVDLGGRLVGINTQILSRSGGSLGIGFAIPSNLVRLYVDSALSGRKVERPWLGVKFEAVTRDVAETLGLQRISGALVSRVTPKSPAEAAGLKPGDVVVSVDGFEVSDPRSIYYRVTTRGTGSKSKFALLRAGKPLTVEIALQAAPRGGADDARNLSGSHPLDGARAAALLPGLADELGIDDETGIVIVSVRPNSVAAGLGFKPGDLIVQIGGQAVETLADLDRMLRQRQRVWTIAVKRGDRILQLQVPG